MRCDVQCSALNSGASISKAALAFEQVLRQGTIECHTGVDRDEVGADRRTRIAVVGDEGAKGLKVAIANCLGLGGDGLERAPRPARFPHRV